ncbi:MAG TPA: thiamine pyrophosphate-binding protein [Candidatus Binatia bacterium]|nr:thiamine pyrophosphate-binding protein [Candidatus Binatia bacterium]
MAERLHAEGVEALFTLGGGHIVELLDGCADAGVRVIGTRHEGSATLAAEGFALATGRPGVAAVTAGPGFTNCLTGFADAALGSVPLVLIGGRTTQKRRGRGAVQDVDQVAMVDRLAKWTGVAYNLQSVQRLTSEALHRAVTDRPGAVYLEVPHDVFMARGEPAGLAWGFPTPLPRSTAAPSDLDRVVSALRAASRPLVLAGGGAFWSGAAEELADFCTAWEIPLTTTSAARGLVADSHPWCLGSLVHAGTAAVSADCVLILGSAFNGNLVYGGPPLFTEEQTLIQVDAAAGELGGNRRADLALRGDVREVLKQLRAAALESSRDGRDWLAQGRELVGLSREMWDRQVDDYAGPLVHPGALAREVFGFARDTWGGAATLVADGGDSLTWGLAYADAERPGRLLSTTTALGTLGVGMPFALGAKLARPEEPVVLLTGDGSFGLSAMELDTAVRNQLPVIVVVANNAGWGDVRHHQREMYHREVASQLADTRYDRLAEALGARGERVETVAGIRPAMERAAAAGVASLIDVPTDPDVLSALLRAMMAVGIM